MFKLFGIREYIPFSMVTGVHIKNYITNVKLRELYTESCKKKDLLAANRRSSANIEAMIRATNSAGRGQAS